MHARTMSKTAWTAMALLGLAMVLACKAGAEPVKKPTANPSAPTHQIQAGKYLAGVDIRPGDWKIHANESDCTWERDTVDWTNGERILNDRGQVERGKDKVVHIASLWQLKIKGGCIGSFVS